MIQVINGRVWPQTESVISNVFIDVLEQQIEGFNGNGYSLRLSPPTLGIHLLLFHIIQNLNSNYNRIQLPLAVISHQLES